MQKITQDAFLHPGDEAAIQTIRKIPGFEKLLSFISKNSFEKTCDITWSSTYLQLTKENAPRVVEMYQKICDAFGLEQIPKLFLRRTYMIENVVIGMETPKILISSSALDNMNDNELETYLVADVAGLVAGHGIYNFIKMLIDQLAFLFPVPQSVLLLPMSNWAKQRYYTYDRARMLYSDDYETVMKLIDFGEAPRTVLDRIGIDERTEQAIAFDELTSSQNAIKTLIAVTKEKPWNTMRIAELYNWVESGMYTEIKEELQ